MITLVPDNDTGETRSPSGDVLTVAFTRVLDKAYWDAVKEVFEVKPCSSDPRQILVDIGFSMQEVEGKTRAVQN